VRFAACHDGRPLADVPAWEKKHNEANGEGNRDGWGGEVAWNGGVEGPTDDPVLLDRRAREVRAMLALLAAAPGTIQLTAGDEFGRTQQGNTNAWCRDDEIGWVLWPEGDLVDYVRRLLSVRKTRLGGDAESHGRDASGLRAERRNPDDASATIEAGSPRTSLIEPFNGSLSLSGGIPQGFALLRVGIGEERSCLIAANAGSVELRFPLPVAPFGRGWRLRVDSALPERIAARAGEAAPFLARETIEVRVAPRSVRILVAEPESDRGS
jgi:pullulanase/glycogen debranching enzyme